MNNGNGQVSHAAGAAVSSGVAEQVLGVGNDPPGRREPAVYRGNERHNVPVNEAARAMEHGRCRTCGRALSDPSSVANGIGPVCAQKASAPDCGEEQSGLQMPCREPYSPDYVSIWREPDGTVHASVPRCVVQHSPTGFECGYSGSGPADLALNIMAAFLPISPGNGGVVKCWRGECSQNAWDLHQAFKRDFVMLMPRDGGQIRSNAIRAWILRRISLCLEAQPDATAGVPGRS